MSSVPFNHLVGNEPIKHYLTRMATLKKVRHLLLFNGPSGVGKSLFALEFAKLLLCQEDPQGHQAHKLRSGNHPDLHVYKPEGKSGMHSIASMRLFCEEIFLPPSESPYKVFLIHDADRMLTYSANALLKTLEEPSANSIIILLTSKPQALLSTIVSRCCSLHFEALSKEEIELLAQRQWGKNQEEAQQLALQANGSAGIAFRIASGQSCDYKELLLPVLQQGHLHSFSQLAGFAKQLSEEVEKRLNEGSKQSRSEAKKDLTAIQHQHVEKEQEGAAALGLVHETQEIFEDLLDWYRDLHLLQVGGNPTYLSYRLQESTLLNVLQQGNLIPLETVHQFVAESRLALERHTPLHLCLESLFLKLNYL